MGTVSLALYMCIGTAGIPIFTNAGAGVAHIAGPTGGYIMGFVFAQAAVGFILDRGGIDRTTLPRASAAMLAGIAVIYLFGATHFYFVQKSTLGLSIQQTLAMSVYPFILADLGKAAVVTAIVTATRSRTARIFR